MRARNSASGASVGLGVQLSPSSSGVHAEGSTPFGWNRNTIRTGDGAALGASASSHGSARVAQLERRKVRRERFVGVIGRGGGAGKDSWP